jgi:hypothetical protein
MNQPWRDGLPTDPEAAPGFTTHHGTKPVPDVGSSRFLAAAGLRHMQILKPAQVEAEVINWLRCLGGQPLTKLMEIGSHQQIPAMHVALAVGRLSERGVVDVTTLSQLVTFNPPKHLSWFRRQWNRWTGGIHPLAVFLVCIALTTASCSLWIYIRSLSV